MPRVANPPAAKGRTASRQPTATPHKQPAAKLSINDDRGEKAARLQSRQALHDAHMNQIKAAASPMRKVANNDRASSSSPTTPRSAAAMARERERAGKENVPPGDGSPLNVVNGSAVTPMKRAPILANFEEWMKMATDNKINARNSWNFALIDYFHDMSLLKEGDGVNFQKASCTLDGCVKIYTSRVDSVATETGKLLSGLADSGSKRSKEGREGEEGEEEDEEGEDGVKKKAKKRAQRSHEATLAPSFASLQLKKLELEFAVDPLFKKASADFDEGGAKGLLLNHLSIDSQGRIVFDSSDDAGDATPAAEPIQLQAQEDSQRLNASVPTPGTIPEFDQDIDLGSLASKFFPDLCLLDNQDICPSMQSFTLGDPSSDLTMPFLKAPDDWRSPIKDKPPNVDANLGDQTGIFLDGSNAAGFDDDDDAGLLGGFDLPQDVGFGEGGEAWAKDAALEPMLRVARVDDNDQEIGAQDGIAVGDFDPANPNNEAYTVSLNHAQREASEHDNILSYFDNALRSQKAAVWAGPEHWRIRKIKQASSAENPAPLRQKKEKEPFEIDFLSPMDQGQADLIYTPAASNSAICLPKTQWKTKGRNLLPDDRHFNSSDLLTLFLKPKARIGRRRNMSGLPVRGGAGRNSQVQEEEQHVEMDEAYWARKWEEQLASKDEQPAKEGDYDANFFADDDNGLPFAGGIPDDDDNDDGGQQPAGFTDAREMLSPPPTSDGKSEPPPPSIADSQTQTAMLPGSFGSQLVTHGGRRLRPEYVNYARVAKKVDVRRLKENLWRGMSSSLMASIDGASSSGDTNRLPTPAPTETDGDIDMMDVNEAEPPSKPTTKEGGELKFTDMIGDLRKVYPEQQMKDISTSYCFICLLHLANEKGLVLEGEKVSMQEILVRKDQTVGEGYVGE